MHKFSIGYGLNILKKKQTGFTFFARKKQTGFTLIELLVVIAMLGILAGFAATILNPMEQIRKSNDARRKSDLSQVAKALEQYYSDYGKYPKATTGYEIMITIGGVDTGYQWGSAWGPYMDSLPKDPISPKSKYVYVPSNNYQMFYLYASLERAERDSQACNSGSSCAGLVTLGVASTACGTTCNYGVTSPNTSP